MQDPNKQHRKSLDDLDSESSNNKVLIIIKNSKTGSEKEQSTKETFKESPNVSPWMELTTSIKTKEDLDKPKQNQPETENSTSLHNEEEEVPNLPSQKEPKKRKLSHDNIYNFPEVKNFMKKTNNTEISEEIAEESLVNEILEKSERKSLTDSLKDLIGETDTANPNIVHRMTIKEEFVLKEIFGDTEIRKLVKKIKVAPPKEDEIQKNDVDAKVMELVFSSSMETDRKKRESSNLDSDFIISNIESNLKSSGHGEGLGNFEDQVILEREGETSKSSSLKQITVRKGEGVSQSMRDMDNSKDKDNGGHGKVIEHYEIIGQHEESEEQLKVDREEQEEIEVRLEVQREELDEVPKMLKPEKVKSSFSKRLEHKQRKEKKLNQKMIELKREYEKLNSHIPQNSLNRQKAKRGKEAQKMEQEMREKRGKDARKVQREKLKKRRDKAKSANKIRTQYDENRKKTVKQRMNKYNKYSTSDLNHKKGSPGKYNKGSDFIFQELKRYEATDKRFGINEYELNQRGLKQLGLVATSGLPIKKYQRFKRKYKTREDRMSITNSFTALRDSNIDKEIHHTKSEEKSSMRSETKNAMRDETKTSARVENKNRKSNFRRRSPKNPSKSAFIQKRNRERNERSKLDAKSMTLDYKLKKLLIQKRKLIKMKLEMMRLEHLIERENHLRRMRNADQEAQKMVDNQLLNQYRATSQKQAIEVKSFLENVQVRGIEDIRTTLLAAQSDDQVCCVFIYPFIYLCICLCYYFDVYSVRILD